MIESALNHTEVVRLVAEFMVVTFPQDMRSFVPSKDTAHSLAKGPGPASPNTTYAFEPVGIN